MDSNVLSVANEILQLDDFNLYIYNNYIQLYDKKFILRVFSYILKQSNDKDTIFYKYFDAFFSIELDELTINNKTYAVLIKKHGEELVNDYFINLLEISDNSDDIKNKYKLIYDHINLDNDSYFYCDSVRTYFASLSSRVLNREEETECFSTMDKCRKNIKIAFFDEVDSIIFKDFDKIINSISNIEQLKLLDYIKNYLTTSDKNKYESIYPKLRDYFRTNNILPNKKSDIYKERYLNEQLSQICEFYKIRQLVIECNLRLVVSIAKRFKSTSLTILDFIQEGNIGLMRAIKKYDVTKGNKLSTYSIHWIRQHIKRCISEQERLVRIPVHIEEKMYTINKTIRFWEGTYGYTPSDDEIAEYLQVSAEDIAFVKNSFNNSSHLSLDANINDDEDDPASLQNFIYEDNDNSEDIVLNEELHNICINALDFLTEKEKFVIIHRFGMFQENKKTLEEVGEMLHLTRERIRQIENKALRKLRHPTRRKIFEGYY